jgi:methylated-DNA-[protein]-cysteine S-methyltransferase
MIEPGEALKSAAAGGNAAAAAERLVVAAAGEGLVDVAYARVGSPFGDLLVAGTRRGLVRIAFLPSAGEEEVLAELAGRLSPRVLEAPGRLDEVRRELEQYFAGRRSRFELNVDWRLSSGFNRRVLRSTARIPYGATSTYAHLAKRAGSPRAYRAAGNALHRNPIPIVVPCHRVLRSGGDLGGYGGGLEMKEGLLRLEGALP